MKKLLLIAVLALAAGCTQFGLTPAKTFPEQVAYTEAGIEGSIKTLMDLTCKKYTTTGACVEAGKPLHPARSLGYLNQLKNARVAAKDAVAMSGAGGDCLGQFQTPTQCLALANAVLGEITKVLEEAQKQKGAVK